MFTSSLKMKPRSNPAPVQKACETLWSPLLYHETYSVDYPDDSSIITAASADIAVPFCSCSTVLLAVLFLLEMPGEDRSSTPVTTVLASTEIRQPRIEMPGPNSTQEMASS
ncbi:hypothetical protein CVT26_013059 [Gymnopilus dilepis]|uniref:Uncharacterized protein n=1 Tax=Gymnopilus dilepis TaxID=231916 RepID=A0A409Y4F3_9AGAR|nr:hypothetical protein CVT26_013059 [Gymnopilus dilepis]